jgi:hypothetical protein
MKKLGLEFNMRQFLVAITKEDDLFIARCPELNVTYQGETLEMQKKILKKLSNCILRALGPKTFRNKFPNLI